MCLHSISKAEINLIVPRDFEALMKANIDNHRHASYLYFNLLLDLIWDAFCCFCITLGL
jgi:hypothetical protein